MKEIDYRQPYWVCDDCGFKAHELTFGNKYIDPITGGVRRKRDISCYHEDTCGACGKVKYVTERRDFFYPIFNIKDFPNMIISYPNRNELQNQDRNHYRSNLDLRPKRKEDLGRSDSARERKRAKRLRIKRDSPKRDKSFQYA